MNNVYYSYSVLSTGSFCNTNNFQSNNAPTFLESSKKKTVSNVGKI